MSFSCPCPPPPVAAYWEMPCRYGAHCWRPGCVFKHPAEEKCGQSRLAVIRDLADFWLTQLTQLDPGDCQGHHKHGLRECHGGGFEEDHEDLESDAHERVMEVIEAGSTIIDMKANIEATTTMDMEAPGTSAIVNVKVKKKIQDFEDKPPGLHAKSAKSSDTIDNEKTETYAPACEEAPLQDKKGIPPDPQRLTIAGNPANGKKEKEREKPPSTSGSQLWEGMDFEDLMKHMQSQIDVSAEDFGDVFDRMAPGRDATLKEARDIKKILMDAHG
jgi:hypothetical protein